MQSIKSHKCGIFKTLLCNVCNINEQIIVCVAMISRKRLVYAISCEMTSGFACPFPNSVYR